MNRTTCSSDPVPIRLFVSHLHVIVPILQHIVNLCLTTGDFPISFRVYNDNVTTVGKGNGSFFVLLGLSATFDTIDHNKLFYILEKNVGIGGSALRQIRSYFCDRTQRVQIDGIMSDFASLLCGVP